MSTLTQDDWHLLTKGHGGSWWLLALMTDYEWARQHAVSGGGGGTYYARDGQSGWYQITKDGLLAVLRPEGHVVAALSSTSKPSEADQVLLWRTLKAWVGSLSTEQVAGAQALRAESAEIQESFPNTYRGIGHTYAWDRTPRGTEAECKADLEALAVVNAQIDTERDAYYVRKIEHDQRVDDFAATLAPTMLDDLVIAQRA